jgi:autotransporter-associated beta strand protein
MITETHARLFGATLLGALWLSTAGTRAVDINQTVSQSGASATGWSAAIWGTPAAAPLATTNYITPGTYFVRTPNNATPGAFAGASLRIDSGGTLWLKHSGANAATANLVMNGGVIQFHGGTVNNVNSILAGTMQVLGNTTFSSDQAAGTACGIWVQSPLTGSSNITVNMSPAGYGLLLSGANAAFSGNWTNSGGFIQIVSGTTNALGSGTVTLVNASNYLHLNSTNDLAVNNSIAGLGYLLKVNTNQVTLGGDNSFTGITVVSNGIVKLTSPTAVTNSATISLAGGTVDATAIGGLVLNTANSQSLNCRGSVTGSLTASTGNTLNFNLTPSTNDILNVSGALTLNGNPTLTLSLAGYKPGGSYRLINYSGSIQGGGSFNLVPPVGSSEIFALDTSVPGQVNLIVTGVSQNLTWAGGNGSWDTSSPNWTGSATVYSAGDNVTFNDNASVSLVDVTLAVSPSSMIVSNDTLNYQFYDLGISTTGPLTKAGAGTLEFTSPNNAFTGPIDIRAGVLSIGAGGNFGSLGSPSAITNNGVFRMNLASGGALISGPISGSGSIELTGGGGTLVLSGTNSYGGLTTIGDQSQLNYSSSSALGSALAGTVIQANGRLGVTSFVGNLTNPEPITVNGLGVTAAPGALYVNTPNNIVTYSGPITIASDARFRVVNAGTRMNFANTVAGNNVALWCTAGNAAADTATTMEFLNTFTLGNGTLTKDGQGIVAFDSASTTCGSVLINGGTVEANGVLNGGPVAVNATGALGGSGTCLGTVTVAAGGSIAPGRSGIGTLTLNNAPTVDPGAGYVMEINRANAQNADLLVAPAIPLHGTLTVVNIGPALQAGDTFDLFNGSLSGTFSATNLPALGQPNYAWDTSLLASQGIIKVSTNSLPLLPLEITDIRRTTTNTVLAWTSYPSEFYTILYATSLSTSAWSVAAANIPANGVTNHTAYALSTVQPAVGTNVTLVQYQMGTTNAQIQDPATLMAAGALTQGAGLAGATWIPNATALGYASSPVLQVSSPSTDFATATANQACFTFTLTVGSNVTHLDLTSLSFNGARGGNSTPRGFGVYVTTPTTTDELVQGATDFSTVRPTWSLQNIGLSSLASLQNLVAGQDVTFKIVVYTPAIGSSVEFDDITVNGNVSPGPLPPYASGDKLFLRVKQQ